MANDPHLLKSSDIFGLLPRTWPFVRPYRAHLRRLALSLIPSAILGLAAFWLIRIFFDVIGNGHSLTAIEARLLGVQIGASRELVLWCSCLVAAAIALCAAPVGFFAFGYAIWILQKISNLFRVSLYERLQELTIAFHSQEKIGDAIYRMFQDSASIPHVINGLLMEPIRYFPFAVMSLLWLAAFNYEMALIAACMVPALVTLAWLFSEPMRRAFLRARETAAQAMSRIEETLASIRTVKAFGTEAGEAARYAEDNWAAFMAARRARMMFVFYRVLANIISGAAHIAALYIGARQVIMHQHGGLAGTAISLGLFQGALVAFGRVSDGGLNLAITWGHLQDVGVGLTRVFEMLDKLPEHDLKSGKEIPRDEVQTLRLENVSFAYDDRARVLDGVNLETREGGLIAIAGPSGSGKTTLLSLLIRFFDPDSGRILLNGRELKQLDLIAYRGLVSAVLQENPLFTGTLLENVTYGRPEADFSEVADAVEMSGLTSFVSDLPSGFATMLGEKGAKLSAGQAQRIGLARAFLRGAPILLLDEPTSALDMATEERVLKGVRQWLTASRGRIAIMMTHRRTAAAIADRTYELKEGRLVEVPRLEASSGVELSSHG